MVVPALAAGCTMRAEALRILAIQRGALGQGHARGGVPAGVFNLINGDGPGVGAPLSAHRDVDMVSFTGSPARGRKWRGTPRPR